MSCTKERSLARRTAWLRLACRRIAPDGAPTGFALQVKWGYSRTADVQRLLDDGHARLERVSHGGRKRVTTCVATPEGEAMLAATLARRGEGFGPASLVRELDPPKVHKDDRRRATIEADPAVRRARAQARTMRRAVVDRLRASAQEAGAAIDGATVVREMAAAARVVARARAAAGIGAR